jgi:hypothetical protein
MGAFAAAPTPQPATVQNDSGDTVEKFMNVKVTPIGLIIGYVNIDVDFKVSSRWSVGPTASYWHWNDAGSINGSDIGLTMYAVGVRGNWYKQGTYRTGFYISPLIQYLSATATARSNNTDISATASTSVFSSIFGYHWFWDSFNLALGGGPSLELGKANVTINDGNSTTTTSDYARQNTLGLVGEFMLGWTF